MPTTNIRIITIVVLAIAVNTTIGLCTVAYCMVNDIKPDTTLITAFVGLVNFFAGALAGMLTRTQPQSAQGPTQSMPISTEPISVQVENKGAAEAVPTEAIP